MLPIMNNIAGRIGRKRANRVIAQSILVAARHLIEPKEPRRVIGIWDSFQQAIGLAQKQL